MKGIRDYLMRVFDNQKWFFVFLVIYLTWILLFYKDYGMAIEEPVDYTFGVMMYNRTFGRDPQLLKDFAYEGKDSREIWSYNHFNTMISYIFNDSAGLEGYHFNNFIFSIFAFFLSYQVILAVAKKPVYALLGPLFLWFTPRYLGSIASNVKDPVFATYYLFALWMLIISPKIKNWWARTLLLGISFGTAAAMRTLGYGLLFVYLILRLSDGVRTPKLRMRSIAQGLIELLLMFGLMVAVHAIEMPYIGSDPIKHLPRLFQMAKDYPWSGQMLYLGKEVSAGQLPWHYVPVWVSVTTPLLVLIFWILAHRLRHNRVVKILLVAFWVNLGLYYLIKPVIYDGVRHLLFLNVIMTVTAAATWLLLWQKSIVPLKKKLLGGVLIIQFLLIGVNYYLLHPYQYLYFNELTGYLPGAFNKFETDYWALSYAEGISWFLSQKWPDNMKTVGLCTHLYSQEYFEDTGFQVSWLPNCESGEKDKVSFMFSSSRNNEWQKVKGNEIHVVKRMNVPLMKIFQTK